MKKRFRLVDDWRRAWRFLSVQAAALLGSLAVVQQYMPEAQQYLPPDTFAHVTIGLSGAIIVLRVIKQFGEKDEVSDGKGI